MKIYNIHSFWFRGEALSTISKVSKFTIQSKTKQEPIWYELTKIDGKINQQSIDFTLEYWTSIIV